MKNFLPLTKIVAMRNYLLCELLSCRYISTQQTVERSTSTVAICRPAVSIDVSPRISSIPVPTHSISPSPPFCWENNLQSQILKRGDQRKMSTWGILKSPCHRYFPGGLLCFFSNKTMEYGFAGEISNVDLGLFQPIN